MTLSPKVQQIVNRFVADLIGALTEQVASDILRWFDAPSGTGSLKASVRVPDCFKPSAADLDQILACVTARPGLRSEEVQRALGATTVAAASAVREGLKKLRAQGRLLTRGERRATTYWAMAVRPTKAKGKVKGKPATSTNGAAATGTS